MTSRTFRPAANEIVPLMSRAATIPHLDGSKCETSLHIGLFFDGTGNNRLNDLPRFADSNVARLADAFPDVRKNGFAKVYVPGVGTEFEEIGEKGESWKGRGYGKGCEARVLFGLLSVLNEIYRHAISNQPLFTRDQIELLCTCENLKLYEARKLAKFRQDFGLLEGVDGSVRRTTFLRERAKELEDMMACRSYPSLKFCTLDVFGFSRGAASARVFCSWMTELIEEGKFAGVPFEIRFLGIFDTVASAGLSSILIGGTSSYTGGHEGWARAKSLYVPALVRNCVHFVAMHEFRKNFPLDEIRTDAGLPEGCLEIAYPGSHSDVGGGYSPGELGVSFAPSLVIADSCKLSQIPLNHMFEYAVTCGVPFDKALSIKLRKSINPFLMSEELRSDFRSFLREIGPGAKPVYLWGKDYLAWRWSVRMRYKDLEQVKHANAEERSLLEKCNQKLIDDAKVILSCGDMKAATKYREQMLAGHFTLNFSHHLFLCSGIDDLDGEAPLVLEESSKTKISPSLAQFFDKYVHDSFAGFAASHLEPTGYWRYRKSFQGNDLANFAEDGSLALPNHA